MLSWLLGKMVKNIGYKIVATSKNRIFQFEKTGSQLEEMLESLDSWSKARSNGFQSRESEQNVLTALRASPQSKLSKSRGAEEQNHWPSASRDMPGSGEREKTKWCYRQVVGASKANQIENHKFYRVSPRALCFFASLRRASFGTRNETKRNHLVRRIERLTLG